MFHRIFPLAVLPFRGSTLHHEQDASPMTKHMPTIARALSIAVLGLGLASSAWTQSSVDYDWEDGQMHGTPTSMQVPPKILTQGATTFCALQGARATSKASPPACRPRTIV